MYRSIAQVPLQSTTRLEFGDDLDPSTSEIVTVMMSRGQYTGMLVELRFLDEPLLANCPSALSR